MMMCGIVTSIVGAFDNIRELLSSGEGSDDAATLLFLVGVYSFKATRRSRKVIGVEKNASPFRVL